MNKYLFVSACLVLGACAAPSVITGNSKSAVIDDGQYFGDQAGITNNANEGAAKIEADKWCAKYGRVSGTEESQSSGRRREYMCVEK